ncbi:uncharacterized protein LOC111321689 isoform X3 [Stylophora pistillata]|uniref:uncharacterized protein LOC111321689 isoform X3 n=1 Tax=Stylophora pistillata TaxID=50429 RepID=UPI000C0492FC|nr:uncharacterized protein LOC111321689 isoform X3 [Stylophora pistillata]
MRKKGHNSNQKIGSRKFQLGFRTTFSISGFRSGVIERWHRETKTREPALRLKRTEAVRGDFGKNNSQRLERLQNQAMRTMLSANRNTCSQEMGEKLAVSSFTEILYRVAFLYFPTAESWKVKLERVRVINNYSINIINTRGNQLGFHCRCGHEKTC